MKRTALFVIVMLVAVVFAATAQARSGFVGPRSGVEFDEVELRGLLRLAENELPIMVSAGVEYTLRIPPALSSELQVSGGQQVNVAGYLVERASFDLLSTQRLVMVRSIEIDGTKYVLPADGFGGRRGRTPHAAPGRSDDWRSPRGRRR